MDGGIKQSNSMVVVVIGSNGHRVAIRNRTFVAVPERVAKDMRAALKARVVGDWDRGVVDIDREIVVVEKSTTQ
jgi:hypothetical protein